MPRQFCQFQLQFLPFQGERGPFFILTGSVSSTFSGKEASGSEVKLFQSGHSTRCVLQLRVRLAKVTVTVSGFEEKRRA